MGPEQPFYALQPKGLSKSAHADKSIESIAATYIQAIKSVQPSGPFHLGGYCFGGVIAYEMSRQLLEADEKVQLLAIFEGYPPSFNPHKNKLSNEWLFAFNFIRNLPFWIRDYMQLSKMNRRYRNHRIVSIFRKRFMRLMGFNIELDKQDILDNVSSLAERYQHVVENNIYAMRHYHIKSFDGPMVLFRTPHRVPGRIEKPDRGWRKFAAEIDIQMIPGGHTTMLKKPNVKILADKLKGYLKA